MLTPCHLNISTNFWGWQLRPKLGMLDNMPIHIHTLRPVGNPILLEKQPLDSGHFANQPVIFYQSGTAALTAALIATKLLHTNKTNRPEVLLPAYACPDLISACMYAGVTPVLVDLEPDTCWMSFKQIESSITDQTIAIIGVRFLGIAERMHTLRAICERNGLILIEDSAQGFPTTDPEFYWQGDLNILSFGRGKPVNMLGGGAVIVRNQELRPYLPIPQINPGHNRDSANYRIKVLLYNTLINPTIYGMVTMLPGLKIGETTYKPLQAIASMPAAISMRLNSNIAYYKTLPNNAQEIHNRLKALSTPQILDLSRLCHHDYRHPLLRFPLLVAAIKKRDNLYHALQKYGATLMYQRPLYEIPGIPPGIKLKQNIKYAKTFSQQLLTLPTHTGVSSKVLDRILNVITASLS